MYLERVYSVFKLNYLVIIDDIMLETETLAEVNNMFTRLAHNSQCFVIFIAQNFCQPKKQARLNAESEHTLPGSIQKS